MIANDLIIRQAAIDIVQGYAEQLQEYNGTPNDSDVYAYVRGLLLSIDRNIKALPSAQPELTDEQAIKHLQSTGWMQNHDREMYEMGLKKMLKDDSGSYDALTPPAQPELETIQTEPCHLCRSYNLEDGDTLYMSSDWDGGIGFDYIRNIHYCPQCGRKLKNG